MNLGRTGTILFPSITFFKKIQHECCVAFIDNGGHLLIFDNLSIEVTLSRHHEQNWTKAGQYIYTSRYLLPLFLDSCSINIKTILGLGQNWYKTYPEVALFIALSHKQKAACLHSIGWNNEPGGANNQRPVTFCQLRRLLWLAFTVIGDFVDRHLYKGCCIALITNPFQISALLARHIII